MNEKQIFLVGFADFARLSLYGTYFTWDLVNAVPNVRVQSLHLFFLQPKLPEPGAKYYDKDQTQITANLNKRAQSRRHRPALDSIAVSLFGNMIVDTGEILVITKEYQIQIIILMLQQGPCLDLVSFPNPLAFE